MQSWLPWSLMYLLTSLSPLLISVFHLCCHALSHTDVLFPPLEFCNTVPDFPPHLDTLLTLFGLWYLVPVYHPTWMLTSSCLCWLPAPGFPPAQMPSVFFLGSDTPYQTPIFCDTLFNLPGLWHLMLATSLPCGHHSYPVWCLTPHSSLPLFEADFLTHLGSGLPPRPFPCSLCWWPLHPVWSLIPQATYPYQDTFLNVFELLRFIPGYLLSTYTQPPPDMGALVKIFRLCHFMPYCPSAWTLSSFFLGSDTSCQAVPIHECLSHTAWASIPHIGPSPRMNTLLEIWHPTLDH